MVLHSNIGEGFPEGILRAPLKKQAVVMNAINVATVASLGIDVIMVQFMNSFGNV